MAFFFCFFSPFLWTTSLFSVQFEKKNQVCPWKKDWFKKLPPVQWTDSSSYEDGNSLWSFRGNGEPVVSGTIKSLYSTWETMCVLKYCKHSHNLWAFRNMMYEYIHQGTLHLRAQSSDHNLAPSPKNLYPQYLVCPWLTRISHPSFFPFTAWMFYYTMTAGVKEANHLLLKYNVIFPLLTLERLFFRSIICYQDTWSKSWMNAV